MKLTSAEKFVIFSLLILFLFVLAGVLFFRAFRANAQTLVGGKISPITAFKKLPILDMSDQKTIDSISALRSQREFNLSKLHAIVD